MEQDAEKAQIKITMKGRRRKLRVRSYWVVNYSPSFQFYFKTFISSLLEDLNGMGTGWHWVAGHLACIKLKLDPLFHKQKQYTLASTLPLHSVWSIQCGWNLYSCILSIFASPSLAGYNCSLTENVVCLSPGYLLIYIWSDSLFSRNWCRNGYVQIKYWRKPHFLICPPIWL